MGHQKSIGIRDQNCLHHQKGVDTFASRPKWWANAANVAKKALRLSAESVEEAERQGSKSCMSKLLSPFPQNSSVSVDSGTLTPTNPSFTDTSHRASWQPQYTAVPGTLTHTHTHNEKHGNTHWASTRTPKSMSRHKRSITGGVDLLLLFKVQNRTMLQHVLLHTPQNTTLSHPAGKTQFNGVFLS